MKSYLIVGGSSDIAKITAQKLLESQAAVTCLVRDKSRVEDLEALGATIVQGDALDQESISEAITKASEKGDGQISGVAHLVGSIAIRPPHALSLDAFNEVITTNLSSAFLTLSLCGKAMLKMGRGRMVFTSSVAGSLGLVNHEAIAAAKGGVESMVRSAAATYAKRGIRVNAICPVLISTEGLLKALDSEYAPGKSNPEKFIHDFTQTNSALNRMPTAKEVGDFCVFLASDMASAITGQCINVDCGVLPQ